jgi:uncharacterized membrane protein
LMRPDFWISHHSDDELHRTLRVGPVHVCARCFGTYPVLFAVLGVQFAMRAPLSASWDGILAVGSLLPALVDWAIGRFRPAWGNNSVRVLTGVLLGSALGRTLYVHVQSPFPPWLWVQLALVAGVAIPVGWRTYRR